MKRENKEKRIKTKRDREMKVKENKRSKKRSKK